MIVVRTLGTAEIEVGETRILPTSPRKFALLLYLAAERGRPVLRTTLQDLIFPDQPEKNARHSLRELVYQLRRIDSRLVADPQSILLPFECVRTDLDAFAAVEHLTIDQLQLAERGFLPGYPPERSEGFCEWFQAYRARTTIDLSKWLVAEIVRARKIGDWSRVGAASRACLGLDPVNEEATLALAEAMAMHGAKAQAFELLDQYSEDVGRRSPELRLAASVVRRRISERINDAYLTQADLPFLGRDREMTILGEQLERAKSGDARCVVLFGEAGIGKTRLGEEFCKNASLSSVRVERVSTQPHDSYRPLAVFADLVPQLLRLPGALGCSPESMAALKRLTVRDAGQETMDASMETSDAASSSIARAISDLIDAITSECSLVLLMDDLQWADDLSRLTIASLVGAKRKRRLLVVLTSRDRTILNVFNTCHGKVTGVRISPLSGQSIVELVDRVFEHDRPAADDALRAWFLESSRGNPFFLRCLLAHFQSTGERFIVPPTVAAVLDQQLGSLTQNAIAVLGTCVCLGRNAIVDRLVAALELPHIQLHAAVAELETVHLIKRSGETIEAAHWLVAEAVNRLISPIALQLLHRRAALTLEADTRSISPTTLWDCAEHWTLAGDSRRAISAMRECAEHTLEIGRPREAAEVLIRAAQMATGDERVDLARSALQLSEASSEHDVVIKASGIARAAGAVTGLAALELSELVARISEWQQIDDAEGRLWAGIGANMPTAHRVKSAFALLLVAEQNEQRALAERVYASLLDLIEGEGAGDERAILVFQLIYHSRFGDFVEADRAASRILNIAMGLSPASAADLQRKSGTTLWLLGDVDRALDAMALAHANARAARLSRLEMRIAVSMVDWLRCIDREDQADVYWKRLEELKAENPDWQLDILVATSLAEDALARNELADAKKWLRTVADNLPTNPAARLTRFRGALEARIRHLEGGRTLDVEAEIHAMTQFHNRGTELGDAADLEIAVVLHLLREAGDFERARATMQRYVDDFRRSRAPYARCLRDAAKLVGWKPTTNSAWFGSRLRGEGHFEPPLPRPRRHAQPLQTPGAST